MEGERGKRTRTTTNTGDRERAASQPARRPEVAETGDEEGGTYRMVKAVGEEGGAMVSAAATERSQSCPSSPVSPMWR